MSQLLVFRDWMFTTHDSIMKQECGTHSELMVDMQDVLNVTKN